MKKRGILLLLFAVFSVIFIPQSYPIYEESVYSGTVKDGQVVEVSGKNFEFRVDSVSSKAIVSIDSSGFIIKSNECRIKDNFDVCVKNISFSHRDLTSYIDIYQAEVEIYRIKSNVDVTHTIDKSSILIDEEAAVELSVENTADIAAKDFTAAVQIPNSIMVTDYEGCKKSFDSITFREDIHPKQVKKCTYKIKGLFGDEFELTADASYFDGVETVSADPDPLSVKVYNHSLKISSELKKSKFDIDESLNLTTNVENINDQYELAVTAFNIKIPDNVLIIKQPKGMVKNNRVLSWSGNLAPKEKKSFVAELQARRTGNYTVAAEASYKISKFLRGADHKSQIEVGCDCPYIYREISPENYAPGEKILMSAFLVNPGNIHSFSNIKIAYSANIPGFQDFSASHAEINPKENIKILSSSFAAPESNESYYFNITAVYSSDNKETFAVKDYTVVKIAEDEAGVIEDREQAEEEKILEESISEAGEETEESVQEEMPEENIPVITLENEKESPLKAYIIIGIISAVTFVIVVLAVFKRKSMKKEVPRPVKREVMPQKRRNIREILELDLLKKENAQIERNKPEIKWEDESYRALKRQIDRLGIQPEGQKPKKSLFGLFRKK